MQLLKEDVVVDGLGQKGVGTAPQGARARRRICVRGDDDHRYRRAKAPQPLLEFETAPARHAHVGNQAVEPARNKFRHEGLRSIESATREIQHLKEIGKGLSYSFVVIYDRDYRRFGQRMTFARNGRVANALVWRIAGRIVTIPWSRVISPPE